MYACPIMYSHTANHTLKEICDRLHMQVVTEKFCAVSVHQSSVRFAIFACKNNTDAYTDSDAMRKLGEVTIAIDDPFAVTNPDKYAFTVSFMFGSTEMKATAVDDQTHTTVAFVAE